MLGYRLLASVVAGLVLAGPGLGAPPGPVRAPDRAGVAGPGADAVCATPRQSAAEAFARHAARGRLVPLATTHTTDAGEIAVLEDDGTLFFDQLAGGTRRSLDVAAATRAFYRTHGDDYDQIAFYCASGMDVWLGSPTALASAFVIRNQIQGIGLDAFDLGAEFGSAARLGSVLVMNGLHRYADQPDLELGIDQFSPLDLLAHEFGHRWLAYVWVDSAGTPSSALLGRSYQHWSFLLDSDASVMEGCSWAVVEPDSFVTDSVTTGFGGLDLYLMGLATREETDSALTVYDGTSWNPPDTYGPVAYPQVGVGCRGRAVYWKVEDIERQNGARVPDAAGSPHDFRLAFVLIVPNGSGPAAADLQKLEDLRAAFVPYFAAATRGRGTADASLDSHAGRVVIEHAPLADTEDASAARPVAARIAIDPGGIPIALDPTSAILHWRQDGGAWNPLPLGAAGPDSFSASIPGPGSDATIEYYLEAASDSAGIGATAPPGGASAPYAYRVGPDGEPPQIAHVPVRAQGQTRLPQALIARVTDNLGLDSVWCEFRTNGGPLQSLAATPAGRDSFQAALGAGLVPGQWVAYRFVARDAAAAGNVAWSNAAFDTLRAQRDWLLDLENGADGMTLGTVSSVYRNLWHLDRGWSSPAGGTAWSFGSGDSTPYAPHAGGYLYLPFVPSVEPGTMLRFDHRYRFEASDETRAWDGGFLEGRGSDGVWHLLEPAAGYSHEFRNSYWPFVPGQPCWSGRSTGWRAEVFDLSALAPGPAILRFLALTDDFVGDEGWAIDHLRLAYANGVVTDVAPQPFPLAATWPNPARRELHLALAPAAPADVEWSLFDLQGRRVATLWKGRTPPGGAELSAEIPGRVGPGLYFTRVVAGGRIVRSGRVAVVR